MKEIEIKYLISENRVSHIKKDFYKLFSSISQLEKKIKINGKNIKQEYFEKSVGQKIFTNLFEKSFENYQEFRLRNINNLEFYLTAKSFGGIEREEFEKEINFETYQKYWELTKNQSIKKRRLKIPYKNYIIEIDKYQNLDLIIAEIEIEDILMKNKVLKLGLDVTNNSEYKNYNLVR